MFRIILSVLFIQVGLFAEDCEPEVPLIEECQCPIILDTLQLDLGLIKFPTPDPFDIQVLR